MTKRQHLRRILRNLERSRQELIDFQTDIDSFEKFRPELPPQPLNSRVERGKRAICIGDMDQTIQAAREMLAGRRPLGPIPVVRYP